MALAVVLHAGVRHPLVAFDFHAHRVAGTAAAALDVHGEADAAQLAGLCLSLTERGPLCLFHRPPHPRGEVAAVVAALDRRLAGHRRWRDEIAPAQLVGRAADAARRRIHHALEELDRLGPAAAALA